MANSISAPKGTRDILPGEIARWQFVEATARDYFERYCFEELRTPLFESTDLFVRGVGAETDIVGKEMYSFLDKGNRPITLRPENTAGVARAYIEHKLYALSQPQKIWYSGPMFRYERPQAGRQRQFYQMGVECVGCDEPRYDAEVIVLATDLLAALALTGLEVQLNSVGCRVCRPNYREALQGYLKMHGADLCENCITRTEKNPLRVLDCKVPHCAPVIEAAPPLSASLCAACQAHQAAVVGYLGAAGISYRLNPRLVRGLDYYTRTVFEITALGLGAQNTVLAGGRYNQLVEELGGPPTAAVGWALGMERLLMLLDEKAVGMKRLDVLLMPKAGAAEIKAFELAHALRDAGFQVEIAGVWKMDKQFKQAERLRARYAVLLGEDELQAEQATLKNLDTREQERVPFAELAARVSKVTPLA